jgi:hypothetical protein
MGVIVISVGVDVAARQSFDESGIFRAVTGEEEDSNQLIMMISLGE